MQNKKAISPLIATVLLIGFVVAIAAVVMIWTRGFVKERAEKEGALSQAQLQCNQVEIEIEDNNAITNVGSITIGGFIVRNSGGGVEDDSKFQNSLKPLESTPANFVSGGQTVIPAIRPEGAGAPLVQCSSKVKKLRA